MSPGGMQCPWQGIAELVSRAACQLIRPAAFAAGAVLRVNHRAFGGVQRGRGESGTSHRTRGASVEGHQYLQGVVGCDCCRNVGECVRIGEHEAESVIDVGRFVGGWARPVNTMRDQ